MQNPGFLTIFFSLDTGAARCAAPLHIRSRVRSSSVCHHSEIFQQALRETCKPLVADYSSCTGDDVSHYFSLNYHRHIAVHCCVHPSTPTHTTHTPWHPLARSLAPQCTRSSPASSPAHFLPPRAAASPHLHLSPCDILTRPSFLLVQHTRKGEFLIRVSSLKFVNSNSPTRRLSAENPEVESAVGYEGARTCQ